MLSRCYRRISFGVHKDNPASGSKHNQGEGLWRPVQGHCKCGTLSEICGGLQFVDGRSSDD